MPGRPAKKGQKYTARIEIKGPQDKEAFTNFKQGLKDALSHVKGRLRAPKRTGRGE